MNCVVGEIGTLAGIMRAFGVCSVFLAAFGKAREVKEWNRLAIGECLAYLSKSDGNESDKA